MGISALSRIFLLLFMYNLFPPVFYFAYCTSSKSIVSSLGIQLPSVCVCVCVCVCVQQQRSVHGPDCEFRKHRIFSKMHIPDEEESEPGSSQSASLDAVPVGIQLRIFQFCDCETLFRALSVSNGWKTLITCDPYQEVVWASHDRRSVSSHSVPHMTNAVNSTYGRQRISVREDVWKVFRDSRMWLRGSFTLELPSIPFRPQLVFAMCPKQYGFSNSVFGSVGLVVAGLTASSSIQSHVISAYAPGQYQNVVDSVVHLDLGHKMTGMDLSATTPRVACSLESGELVSMGLSQDRIAEDSRIVISEERKRLECVRFLSEDTACVCSEDGQLSLVDTRAEKLAACVPNFLPYPESAVRQPPFGASRYQIVASQTAGGNEVIAASSSSVRRIDFRNTNSVVETLFDSSREAVRLGHIQSICKGCFCFDSCALAVSFDCLRSPIRVWDLSSSAACSADRCVSNYVELVPDAFSGTEYVLADNMWVYACRSSGFVHAYRSYPTQGFDRIIDLLPTVSFRTTINSSYSAYSQVEQDPSADAPLQKDHPYLACVSGNKLIVGDVVNGAVEAFAVSDRSVSKRLLGFRFDSGIPVQLCASNTSLFGIYSDGRVVSCQFNH
eukprot:ANDGO_08148.mRNA.1 hypothetical protein